MGTYLHGHFHVNLSGVGQNFSFPTLFDSYRELLLTEENDYETWQSSLWYVFVGYFGV